METKTTQDRLEQDTTGDLFARLLHNHSHGHLLQDKLGDARHAKRGRHGALDLQGCLLCCVVHLYEPGPKQFFGSIPTFIRFSNIFSRPCSWSGPSFILHLFSLRPTLLCQRGICTIV